MNDWTEKDGSLNRTFEFDDFKEALGFINKVGAIAEELDHHPDICLENYKQVRISITTHDAGNSLTDKDYSLASEINKLV